MHPLIKHLRVNWIDGMKISKEHFVQLENALGDQVRDISGIYLSAFNYGLLPSGLGSKNSLDIQIFRDLTEQVVLKVLECHAVTPGGARIEVTRDAPPIEAVLDIERLKTQAYEIYLVVDLFARVPTGQPDPEESPLRQPFVMPQYRLEVLPFPQTHQPEYSSYQLCVGRLRIEGETVKLSEHYIPPCASLMGHPRLMAAHQQLLAQLGEAEVAATGIIQRIKTKVPVNQLDHNLLYLAEKVVGFIAHTLDEFRLLLLQQPPIQLVTFFARFARVINISLNALPRKHKEELLDYFHKWYELAPRDMENQLRTLLSISYAHNDIYDSLNKVELFADRMLLLLKKLNELNYVRLEEQEEKLYGWLAIHSENRKPFIIQIKTKSTIIGRTDGKHQDVDLNIKDDSWVSRHHAKLTMKKENGETQFHLRDLNSNNGTFIHDTKTRLKPNDEFVLMDGDTFQVGKTNVLFKSSSKIDSEKALLKYMESIDYYDIIEIKDLVVG